MHLILRLEGIGRMEKYYEKYAEEDQGSKEKYYEKYAEEDQGSKEKYYEKYAEEDQGSKERLVNGRKASLEYYLEVIECFLPYICGGAFFGWEVFVSRTEVYNVEVATVIGLVIIAAWNYFGSSSFSIENKILWGICRIIFTFLCFGAYLLNAGSIKSEQWGNGEATDARYWIYVGINFLIYIIITVVFNLIGRRKSRFSG